MEIKEYNFFCNFCGKKFQASRWDAKTCTHICRTRNARKKLFVTEGNDNGFCVICGSKYLITEKESKSIFCDEKCWKILNKIKIYGITDEIARNINNIIKSKIRIEEKEKRKSLIKKIIKTNDENK